jgi:hypothetical protein
MYVLNRAHTRSIDEKTPYEAWYGKKPAVDHLRVFGCVAHVKSARPFLRKLADRSIPMVFIGHEPGSKAYRVYGSSKQRMHVSRDIVFDEGESWDRIKDGGDNTGAGDDFVVDYIISEPAGSISTPAAHSATAEKR